MTKKRAKAHYYGEALTSDEVLEWLYEEDKACKNKKQWKCTPTPEPQEDETQESHNEGNPFTQFACMYNFFLILGG